jgi:hypothetical protein
MEGLMNTKPNDEPLLTVIKWNSDHIIEVFDNNPNITLRELSRKSGHDISDLINILKNHVGD